MSGRSSLVTSPATREQVRLALAERLWLDYQRRDPFGAFCKWVTPEWDWDWNHLVFTRQEIYKAEAGKKEGKRFRLIICEPPQHGKTEMATIRYGCYRFWRNPDERGWVLSYNQERAERDLSLPIQRICEEKLGMEIDPRQRSLNLWAFKGRRGFLRAAGVGSGIAGKPADFVLLDDLFGNSGDAESPAYRREVWRWIKSDVYPRLQESADLIAVNTRWHESDHIGQILASEWGSDFRVVILRSIGEGDDPAGFVRDPSGALCPQRFSIQALEDKRRVMGAEFETQYQCRPYKRGGSMFPVAKAEIVPAAPASFVSVWRGWDKAATAGGGDYSAGVLVGKGHDGLFYVLDCKRGQWAAAERNAMMKQTAFLDGVKYPAHRIHIEQEPGSGGKESAELSIRELAPHPAEASAMSGRGAKADRWRGWEAQWQAGNVRIVAGDWNEEYLAEHEAAPNGAHDDQIDATYLAFSRCALADNGITADDIGIGGNDTLDLIGGF